MGARAWWSSGTGGCVVSAVSVVAVCVGKVCRVCRARPRPNLSRAAGEKCWAEWPTLGHTLAWGCGGLVGVAERVLSTVCAHFTASRPPARRSCVSWTSVRALPPRCHSCCPALSRLCSWPRSRDGPDNVPQLALAARTVLATRRVSAPSVVPPAPGAHPLPPREVNSCFSRTCERLDFLSVSYSFHLCPPARPAVPLW